MSETTAAKSDLTFERFRAKTFRYGKVRTLAEGLEFVNQRGFAFFWPIQGFTLPSLWQAVAGNRGVPTNHDDPGHITWGWKDQMLGQRKWYYAKVLRRKGTLISLELAPCFYALSANFGDPEQDYLEQYRAGLLSPEAKAIYEALLEHGPLHTQALRRKSGLSKQMYRFGKALDELQADFKVIPSGVVEEGRWNYAYSYDLVHRHLPQIPVQAGKIDTSEARERILKRYFASVGQAAQTEVQKLFGWDLDDLMEALEALSQTGLIRLRDGVWQLKTPGRSATKVEPPPSARASRALQGPRVRPG